MIKKIKFALEMKDGVNVRTLEELREHFDVERIGIYFFNGKLQKWLEDRYYEKELDAIQKLEKEESDLSAKLCQILGVPVPDTPLPPIEDMAENEKKKEILRQLTTDETILEKAEQTAFTQEDLTNLIQTEGQTIYLCGDKFIIPLSETPRTFIGLLKTPEIEFKESKYDVLSALAAKRLILQNVTLPTECRFDMIFNIVDAEAPENC